MLTAREREILQLLADGLSNGDVADEALHLAGDGQEPRAPHPHEARGRHPDARGRDRAPRRDHRLGRRVAERDRLDRLIAAEQDERRRLALFLHDGPVQQLSGIALMLDGAAHAIASGRVDEAQRILGTALEHQRADDPRAARTSRSRSSRSSSATRASARRCARSPTSSAARTSVRIDLDIEQAVGARRDDAGRALHDHPRALDQSIRRGPPTRIGLAVARTDDGGVSVVVEDDAEPSAAAARSRRSRSASTSSTARSRSPPARAAPRSAS